MRLFKFSVFWTLVLSNLSGYADGGGTGTGLSPAQMDRVGGRIWQNECGGKVAGLTSWNAGEDFASLGIGHFIWYPQGRRGPFAESFPPLLDFLNSRGIATPAWARGPCPWPTKAAFDEDRNGQRQQELRALLSHTVRQQTEFIVVRMEAALPKMTARSNNPAAVQRTFDGLKQTPEGTFCLIDYVNFKGEGTSPKERYQEQGWGLLQVLEDMPRSKTVLQMPKEFAEAAKRVLSRRVANAPPERKEQRWLSGWHSRCDGYKRAL